MTHIADAFVVFTPVLSCLTDAIVEEAEEVEEEDADMEVVEVEEEDTMVVVIENADVRGILLLLLLLQV